MSEAVVCDLFVGLNRLYLEILDIEAVRIDIVRTGSLEHQELARFLQMFILLLKIFLSLAHFHLQLVDPEEFNCDLL